MQSFCEPPKKPEEPEQPMGPHEKAEAWRVLCSGWDSQKAGKPRLHPFGIQLGKAKRWRDGYDAAERHSAEEKAREETLLAIERSSVDVG